MSLVSARELLGAGAHFGHRVRGSNPKMERYIFGRRNKVQIIDIRHTISGMIEAYHFLQKEARAGSHTLFVGTKRQARDVIRREAGRSGSYFVVERWLGGTLTNLRTIRKQVTRLQQLEKMELDGTLETFTKKMVAKHHRDRRKLVRNFEGIRDMDSLPSAVVVVDPKREDNVVKEAFRLGIPIIALLDTDCDPDPIDIPVPVNDDAVRVIDMLITKLADAIVQGKVLAGRFVPPTPGAEAFTTEQLEEPSASASAETKADKSALPSTATAEDESVDKSAEGVPAAKAETESGPDPVAPAPSRPETESGEEKA